MKIAVFANMNAGGGRAAAAVTKIAKAWSSHELFGVSGFGGEKLPRSIIPEAAEGYVPRLNAAVRALLRAKPKLLVTVGGDGAAAYAAECLIREGSTVPILGIGAGTANVGPIVSFTAGDLPDPESLKAVRLGAVEALDAEGRHIAYAFNDAVIGNTFLGTSPEGETKTYEACALADRGELVQASPVKNIFAGEARMSLGGKPLEAPPYPAAQLVVSPVAPDRFYGRAYTGLLCYTPDSPYKAAAYVSPHPVVSMEEDDAGFASWRTGGQLLLAEGAKLTLEGLRKEICAVTDGNPYLLPGGSVTLQYEPDVIRVMKRRQS